jgi:hypothetical protein
MAGRVPLWWMPYVADFERRADAAVAGLPLTLTSWGRTISRNRAVGGAARSQHLLWTAADFAGSRSAKLEAMRRARALGLVALDEGDHLHLQRWPAGSVPESVFAHIAVA